MLAKDETEQPIPDSLRPTFAKIAKAFAMEDFRLASLEDSDVAEVDNDTARRISENISDYGDRLTALSDEVWDRSIYTWSGNRWTFLIDLSTEQEKVSDLVLHAHLEGGPENKIEVYLVYVP